MKDPIIIGERIAHFRKLRQISQADVASFCGVTPQAVSKWEKGQAGLTVESVLKLSQLFEVSVNELLDHPYKKETPLENTVLTYNKFSKIYFSVLTLFYFFLPFGKFVIRYGDYPYDVTGYEILVYGNSGPAILLVWTLFLIVLLKIAVVVLVMGGFTQKLFQKTLPSLLDNIYVIVGILGIIFYYANINYVTMVIMALTWSMGHVKFPVRIVPKGTHPHA